MTEYTEKDYWEDARFIKWDRRLITSIGASFSDIRALCDMGLPDWVAPHINFELYDIETDRLKLGEDADDRDIFINLKSLQVLVGENNQLLNSSAFKLRQALQLYAIMIEKAILIDKDAAIENKIDSKLVYEFQDKLNKLDPQCLVGDTF